MNTATTKPASVAPVESRWRHNDCGCEVVASAEVTTTFCTALRRQIDVAKTMAKPACREGRAHDWVYIPSYTRIEGPSAPPAERDWAPWLPGKPLPDTGAKVFKVGDVWAVSTGHTEPCVARVTEFDQPRPVPVETPTSSPTRELPPR